MILRALTSTAHDYPLCKTTESARAMDVEISVLFVHRAGVVCGELQPPAEGLQDTERE